FVPSKCSISGLAPWLPLPTAHTSVEDTAVTAESEASPIARLGLCWMVQACEQSGDLAPTGGGAATACPEGTIATSISMNGPQARAIARIGPSGRGARSALVVCHMPVSEGQPYSGQRPRRRQSRAAPLR